MRDSNAPSIASRVAEWGLTVFILMTWSHNAYGQSFSATAGMGLQYFNSPSIARYLNYEIGGVMPGTYTTAIQFMAGADYRFTGDWEIGVEYAYITRSVSGSNNINIDYSYSLPTLIVRRITEGDGFYFRYGAGIGYHFGSLGTTSAYSSSVTNYSARGLGFKVDGTFDTKLDQNFYARITVEGRGELVGTLKGSNGNALTYTTYNGSENQDNPVNMNFSGVGITFGLVYYF